MNKETHSSKSSQPALFGTINPQKLLILILNKWYVYVIAFILAVGSGILFLKYKIPTYNMTTTILIEEEEPLPGADLLEGFAVRPGVQNLDNQIFIVTSYSLIRRVLEQLPFEVDVYRKGLMSKASYFPMSPIRVEPGPEGLPYGGEFAFRFVEGDKFHLTARTKNFPELPIYIWIGKLIL